MQIAIISDIHDNLTNFKKVLDYIGSQNINKIICSGDLTSVETLYFFVKNYKGDIYYAFGNADNEQLRDLKNGGFKKQVKFFESYGELEFDKYKIAFVHFPEIAKELAETGNYSHVFYGHTHKPWQEKVGSCILLNSGNVANLYYSPTFAIWGVDRDAFKLIMINELK